MMNGLGLIALVLIVGCSGSYGRVQWDADVTEQFENNQAQPQYRYYYHGVGMQTYAVVGLDPKFEMQSKIWRDLATDTEDFKVVTSRIWDNDYYFPHYPKGAYILDTNGEKVGVYYSSLIYVTIKFQPEGRVMVIPDNAFLMGPGGRKDD